MKRLADKDREKLLTAIVYLVRTGTEIYRDYRSGDCAGVAKEIIGLATLLRSIRRSKSYGWQARSYAGRENIRKMRAKSGRGQRSDLPAEAASAQAGVSSQHSAIENRQSKIGNSAHARRN